MEYIYKNKEDSQDTTTLWLDLGIPAAGGHCMCGRRAPPPPAEIARRHPGHTQFDI